MAAVGPPYKATGDCDGNVAATQVTRATLAILNRFFMDVLSKQKERFPQVLDAIGQ